MDPAGTAVRTVEHSRIALAEVGRRGRMSLTFALRGGRTILEDAYCEIPFKITRVLHSRGPEAHLMLMQCSAGLFGGDDLQSSIHIKTGARVRITQQAATKIHPSQNRRAIQKLHILVEACAALRIHFEPIIPFAGSHLVQTTRIDAQPGARISYWESFMAGRIARGECWQFDELSSETDFRVGGKSVYLERFLLPNGLERSACGMAGCGYWGTGLYMDAHDDAAAGRLHRALPAAGVDRLPSGLAAVRLVAATGPEFHASRAAFECETGTVA